MGADVFFPLGGMPELDCPGCGKAIVLGAEPVATCPQCGWAPGGKPAASAPGTPPATPGVPVQPLRPAFQRNGWA